MPHAWVYCLTAGYVPARSGSLQEFGSRCAQVSQKGVGRGICASEVSTHPCPDVQGWRLAILPAYDMLLASTVDATDGNFSLRRTTGLMIHQAARTADGILRGSRVKCTRSCRTKRVHEPHLRMILRQAYSVQDGRGQHDVDGHPASGKSNKAACLPARPAPSQPSRKSRMDPRVGRACTTPAAMGSKTARASMSGGSRPRLFWHNVSLAQEPVCRSRG